MDRLEKNAEEAEGQSISKDKEVTEEKFKKIVVCFSTIRDLDRFSSSQFYQDHKIESETLNPQVELTFRRALSGKEIANGLSEYSKQKVDFSGSINDKKVSNHQKKQSIKVAEKVIDTLKKNNGDLSSALQCLNETELIKLENHEMSKLKQFAKVFSLDWERKLFAEVSAAIANNKSLTYLINKEEEGYSDAKFNWYVTRRKIIEEWTKSKEIKNLNTFFEKNKKSAKSNKGKRAAEDFEDGEIQKDISKRGARGEKTQKTG